MLYDITCADGTVMEMNIIDPNTTIELEIVKLNQSLVQFIPPKKAISFKLKNEIKTGEKLNV